MQILKGIKFPDYVFQEYPKWVTPEGKAPVLVNSAEEEAALQPAKRGPGRPPKASE